MKTQAIANLKPEFILNEQEIIDYKSLPKNMPDIKLSAKQIEFVNDLYRKYLEGKVCKGWGIELFEIEKGEKWPSGPRMKGHEAKRIILNNLIEHQSKKQMSDREALRLFFAGLQCRESYQILLSKIYEVKY
jgi:hypothetical protein